MTKTSQVVTVSLRSRSYDIYIAAGGMKDVSTHLPGGPTRRRVVVVADENVVQSHTQTIVESLRAGKLTVDVIDVPSGESSKSPDMAIELWNRFVARNIDRQTLVIAVGGGVIGDLAGFVAATYGRGLDLYQVPTTLLAMVDSSVGGKVGINLPAAKNMVGCFWQPVGVLIDPDALTTLPDREYRSGLAEVVKYGVILDADFFVQLESSVDALRRRDAATLQLIIARCCRLKADIVEQDERETTGLRAVLNYGHTFAHAIETIAGYGEWLHGEAVAIGMVCAARLARELGRVDDSFVRRQRTLLDDLGLPTDVPDLDRDALLAAMQKDKKVENGQVRFVLPTKLGQVETVAGVDLSLAREALVND